MNKKGVRALFLERRASAITDRKRALTPDLFVPVFAAHIAQLVEHFLGKEEVTGSNPVVGSTVCMGPTGSVHL